MTHLERVVANGLIVMLRSSPFSLISFHSIQRGKGNRGGIAIHTLFSYAILPLPFHSSFSYHISNIGNHFLLSPSINNVIS